MIKIKNQNVKFKTYIYYSCAFHAKQSRTCFCIPQRGNDSFRSINLDNIYRKTMMTNVPFVVSSCGHQIIADFRLIKK